MYLPAIPVYFMISNVTDMHAAEAGSSFGMVREAGEERSNPVRIPLSRVYRQRKDTRSADEDCAVRSRLSVIGDR